VQLCQCIRHHSSPRKLEPVPPLCPPAGTLHCSTNINAQPFDVDGVPGTFSTAELQTIQVPKTRVFCRRNQW
jgi:hypothetical protein